ncbi:predicted protein [Phaeodactylum tricornutum CCAP 1055/1]|jgi:hypothetical protein|uniref:Hikeshi-like domain-containing protein n=1 Tax=Phaeodactylum tricornutum (strain CCAP 1055/1) TaxID=556484 RepID=B7FX44_PHATC|nr:predicted protein [Phaeodactylum tricornutum CCAP 1055/1]EEC49097.1 predicted protein [Phaeodactylum tricornutum CCAP 1055/1]|eukprot:XP_002179274.1 predicted protein [Phaeodactylum tricornutum CCAP 1055/1]
MNFDFSLQPNEAGTNSNAVTQVPTNGASQHQSPQPFGIIVPGYAVRTNFVPVDSSGMKFGLTLTCPGDIATPLASVHELVFFTLPNIPFPPNYGVLCYWQITAAVSQTPDLPPPSTGFELLGSIRPDRPSSVFHTGWSEHEQLLEVAQNNTPVTLTIGVSLEPLENLQNIAGSSVSASKLFVAQKIASDLFNFMQSFDTGTGGAGQMVVPNNIFERWFKRFEARFQRDPNFFLKSED